MYIYHRLGSMTVDRYLMVYDLRTMRPLPPLHIPMAPMYLRYVPSFSNRIIVVSQVSCSFVMQHIERYQLLENSSLSYWGAKSKYLKILSQGLFWDFTYRISSNKHPRGVQFSGEVFIRNIKNTHLKTPKTLQNINKKCTFYTILGGYY